MEDAILVAPDEAVGEDAAVMKIVVLLAAVGDGAAGVLFAGTPPSALRAARVGSAAAMPGSGMLTYESVKMSSCAPSRKLYRLLYTGGEYVPSNICGTDDRQRGCTAKKKTKKSTTSRTTKKEGPNWDSNPGSLAIHLETQSKYLASRPLGHVLMIEVLYF